MSGPRGNPEAPALLSLGSNLGNREETLLRAFARIGRSDGLLLEAASSLYETEPVGFPAGRLFVNAACAVRTALPPRDLLDLCFSIERELGRTRGGPSLDRTLDIDLLAYGDLAIAEPDLSVPHPRLRERLFVLVPLAEIRPDVPLPPDGRTVREILRAHHGGGWARRVSSRGEAR